MSAHRPPFAPGPVDGEGGFSLAELLVVVVIIGILAGIAIPAFLSQRDAAYGAVVQSDLRNVAVQAEDYYATQRSYVGFDADPAFTDFTHSRGVVLTLDPANVAPNGYCIQAQRSGVTWSVRTHPAAGRAAIADTPCP